MRHRIGHMLALGVVAVLAGIAAPSARADFHVDFFIGGALIYTVHDDPPVPGEDDNPATGVIGLSSTGLGALNAALAGAGSALQFNSFGATANFATPTDFANLTINGETQGTGTVTIDTSASDYTFPVGPDKFMDSSGSNTYTNAVAGASNGDFTSYFNPTTQTGRETASGTLFFASSSQTTVNSQSGNAPTLFLPGAPDLFSLENVMNLTAVGDANTKIGFTGTTTVRVPEPGSMALLILGGSALAARRIRRRKPLA